MLDKVSDYSLVYVIFKSKTPNLPASFLRRSEILEALGEGIERTLSEVEAHHFADIPDLSMRIFEELLKSNVFQVVTDPVAGEYFQINPDKYGKFRQGFLESNEIFKRNRTVGPRFFPEVFNQFSRAIANGDFDKPYADESSGMAPASDRLVPLNHNSPEYQEISSGLSELLDEVRVNNEVGDSPEERDRILRSLKAANEIWAALELKVIQIKVGVLIAVEDAGKALEKVGKASGWALLIDGIKHLVKCITGLDI